jgi:hypothetical protein
VDSPPPNTAAAGSGQPTAPVRATSTHERGSCPTCDRSAPPPSAGAEAATGTLTTELRHLYVCEQRSTYAIAALVEIDRQRVGRLLSRAGVPLRPKGTGVPRPARRIGEPADLPGLLADLYVQRAMSSSAIGNLLGLPARTVRDRLAQAGITTRPRGNRPRQDRRTLAHDDLEALYVQTGLPADEVGRLLDASRGTVLRNIHDLGLPVRVGGPTPARGPEEIELIDALYDDPQVADTLARHDVPVRAAGGRLWERFPAPVTLTAPLLADLYTGCGIAVAHIELLTGRPAPTITRHLHAAGIALRPRGGRCPFLRRWRSAARMGGLDLMTAAAGPDVDMPSAGPSPSTANAG